MATVLNGVVAKRVCPDDGVAYTYDELHAYYKGTYSKKQIKAYWENCKPVKKKPNGKKKERKISNETASTAPSTVPNTPAHKASTDPVGLVTNVEIGEEKTQKDYYDKATHYDLVWGTDNIHLGYYPHLVGSDLVVLDNVAAADALTQRMIKVGQINHTSTVLDLGCGKGQACRVIAERTGAAVTGIDLGTTNIQRANEVAASRPDLRMKFFEGSFTDLPKEVTSEKYSVVFSQVAFCHVHKQLPLILEQVKGVLAPGGVLIVNDYLGGDKGVSDLTKEHVWKRLHFEYLHGHLAWRKITEDNGFIIEHYENLDRHMAQTYRDMAKKAKKLGLKSTDGAPLAVNYSQSVHAIEKGEVGMNLARLSLLSDMGNPREPLQQYTFVPAPAATAQTGIVANVEIGEEKNQKDYYDKATHYDLVWGTDNIHLGYYPHLAGNGLVVLDNVAAADALTQQMIEVGRINHASTVLDLGCGKGQSCRVIAENTGASVTGIDLGTTNIKRANEVAASRPDLRMKFFEGSFTDLPKEVASEKYSVVFSQVAFCHVHKLLPDILKQVKRVLAPGGLLIVNDYLGGDKGVSDLTKEHVWKRLHFEHLHGHRAWRKITEDSGFVMQYYENLDRHMAQTYRDMAKKADRLGLKSTDGAPLATNYSQSVNAIEKGEVGMNLALLSL